jgi:spore germination cell wall hydrolase CwlJ-like protein
LIGVVLLTATAVVSSLELGDSQAPVKVRLGLNRKAALPHGAVAAQAAAPPIAPQIFEQMSPEEAERVNASVPVSALPNPPAAPFKLVDLDSDAGASALTCLTTAIYYEAANQAPTGQAAVAQVVLNRVRNPHFPKSICGVVFQGANLPTGCQFTFTCDGSLARPPSPPFWRAAQEVARRALEGYVQKDVGLATHYHTVWVVPYWQQTVLKVGQIGPHVFYRMSGALGAAPAFTGQYAGTEQLPSRLGTLRALLPLAVREDAVHAQTVAAEAAEPTEQPRAPGALPPPPVLVGRNAVDAPVLAPPSLTVDPKDPYFGRAESSQQHLPLASHW